MYIIRISAGKKPHVSGAEPGPLLQELPDTTMAFSSHVGILLQQMHGVSWGSHHVAAPGSWGISDTPVSGQGRSPRGFSGFCLIL